MLAVAEVDDDIDISSIETEQASNEPEVSKEAASLHPPALSMVPISVIENEEETVVKTENPPLSVPPASKPHLSRISLFHRNTIDVCDHLGDRR